MVGVTYRYEIVVYRVITSSEGARHFLEDLKDELKTALDQEEILIVERDVETL